MSDNRQRIERIEAICRAALAEHGEDPTAVTIIANASVADQLGRIERAIDRLADVLDGGVSVDIRSH